MQIILTFGANLRHKMKRFLILLCVLVSSISAAQAQETYFTIDDMPDLVKCLPAPPDTTSLDFAHDVMRYMWGKTMRSDICRAAVAERDAIWNLDTLAAIFSVPFGKKIDKDETPEIYKAFVRGVSTIELIRIRPKAHFMRKRPFDRFQEHMYTTREEDELRGEGSYPSGHTIRGWAAALILAEINPAAANDLYARGWEYGESRVIVGAHWQSDVDASRPAASIGYSLLQTSPAYREQMDKARMEFAALDVNDGYFVTDATGTALADNLWTFSTTHPDGFTLDVNTWEEPEEGISVAYSATQGSHDRSDLEFVVNHAKSNGGYVGGWLDTESGRYYFDSVRIFPEDSLEQALDFARQNEQKAVYIISSGREVRLGY